MEDFSILCLPFSFKCSPLILPENLKKPKVFWCFQGDQKGALERKGLISYHCQRLCKFLFPWRYVSGNGMDKRRFENPVKHQDKVFYNFLLLAIFAKSSIIDLWLKSLNGLLAMTFHLHIVSILAVSIVLVWGILMSSRF